MIHDEKVHLSITPILGLCLFMSPAKHGAFSSDEEEVGSRGSRPPSNEGPPTLQPASEGGSAAPPAPLQALTPEDPPRKRVWDLIGQLDRLELGLVAWSGH